MRRNLALLALCIAAGIGLGWLLIANALDKGISTLDRVVMLVIGLAVAAVLWRLEFPKGASRAALVKPKGRARAMNVGLGVFAVLATVVGLMAPRTAVESEPGVIERLARSISGDVREIKAGQEAIGKELGIGAPSLIRRNIAGLWGEPGCAVVRRFELTDRALTVATVTVPQGMKPLRWAFTIEAEANEARPGGMRGSSFTATEREGLFPGTSVKFRYLTDGVSEQLVWDSESQQQAAPELVRCG